MQIKGSSINSTLNFIVTKFPERKSDWLSMLPEKSNDIFGVPVYTAKWYPFIEGMILPTKTAAMLFYGGDNEKASYEIGKFSAEEGLKGIYKLFVRVASTSFVLRKTTNIFNTYYDGAAITIIEKADSSVKFKVTGIKTDGKLIFNRIAGWMEKTIEIVNNKPINVTFTEEEKEDSFVDAIITAVWS